jgi:transcription-repair coupling factor (superfamily II helicase)
MWKTRFFRRTESFLDYISEKTVILSKIRRLFIAIRQAVFKAEEAFENCQRDIKHATPDQLF